MKTRQQFRDEQETAASFLGEPWFLAAVTNTYIETGPNPRKQGRFMWDMNPIPSEPNNNYINDIYSKYWTKHMYRNERLHPNPGEMIPIPI